MPGKQDWGTPQWIINTLGPFDLDVAASAENAKAPRYYTKEQNGLDLPWEDARVWCNPPFAKIIPWVMKAEEELELGTFWELFLLVPVSSSTAWFRKAYFLCTELYLFDKRLQFEGAPGTAREDHCLFYYNSENLCYGDAGVMVGHSLEEFNDYLNQNYR